MYTYNQINAIVGRLVPSTTHLRDNKTFAFFARQLFKRALSVFEWTIPEEWALNYFLYTLYGWGYIAVTYTDKYGLICQQCTLSGYDIYYQPTEVIIANPNLPGVSLQRTIGQDVAIIRLQPDYSSICDVVAYYAEKLALLSQGIDNNTLLANLGYVFKAGNKAESETIKKAFDKLASGDPIVVIDKSTNIQPELFDRDVGRSYVVPKMLADFRTVNNEFNTVVGIANANTQKKERLITDEVNANNQETRALSQVIFDTVKKDLQTVYKVTGLTPAQLDIKWKEAKEDEGISNDMGIVSGRQDNI